MSKYRYPAAEATKLSKHGIDLTLFDTNVPAATVCRVSVKEGHFQEFYDIKNHYIYYIISGHGTFMLNDEPVKAEPGDLIVIPPKTRIHYFGTMEMVLTNAPAFNEANERHVRFVDKSESPYSK